MNNKIEELRAAAQDETLRPEQREEAARLLADMEKPKTTAELLDRVFAGIDAKAAAYRADQLARAQAAAGSSGTRYAAPWRCRRRNRPWLARRFRLLRGSAQAWKRYAAA